VDEVVGFFAAGESNIALVMGKGTVVIDVDDPAFLDQVIEHCGDTPQRTLTPRGGLHLWYRMRRGVHYGNSVKIKGKPVDLRCEGAYACVPWSRNAEGVAYRWAGPVLPAADLPLVKISWLRVRKRPQSIPEPICSSADIDLQIRRARAYLATIEGAVSGNGGHNATFRVACILCVRFGLSYEQAWPLMKEWNEHCEPPWDDAVLRHKILDAQKKRGTPRPL
jgi:hypothetical protein